MKGLVHSMLRRGIIGILKRHRGMENAITIARISRMLSHKDRFITNPVLRSVIRRIIRDQKLLIGSCRLGYFVIATEPERELYLDNLIKRKTGIEERINWVKKFNLK
jgi:hypothetical protein